VNGLDFEHMTIGQLLDAVCAVKTREEAHAFMAAYRAVSPHAGQNVGYIAGYRDPATARRIWDWFECAHPVFGTHVPDTDEALAAGRKLAEGRDAR
jgi:hypothetical protein